MGNEAPYPVTTEAACLKNGDDHWTVFKKDGNLYITYKNGEHTGTIALDLLIMVSGKLTEEPVH